MSLKPATDTVDTSRMPAPKMRVSRLGESPRHVRTPVRYLPLSGKPDTPYVVGPARRTMSRAEKLKPTFNLTKNAASVTEIPTGVIPHTMIVESQM